MPACCHGADEGWVERCYECLAGCYDRGCRSCHDEEPMRDGLTRNATRDAVVTGLLVRSLLPGINTSMAVEEESKDEAMTRHLLMRK